MGEPDFEVLASKLIHEMFHAFQMLNNESRFPNELEALMNYNYSIENLSLKLEENKLIVKLINDFNEDDYNRILALRKYRLVKFEYEYKYEAAVEQIEGSANYVELNALRQISEEKYDEKFNSMLTEICESKNCIPIRIISYSIGALIFYVLDKNSLYQFESFANQPATVSILKDAMEYKENIFISPEVEEMINKY